MAEITTASVFKSGRSQAVRIPKALQFDVDRVAIRKRGNSLILTPVEKTDQWASMKEAIALVKEEGLTFEVPEKNDWEGYPRVGFDENSEHFEARVREYERKAEAKERAWRQVHDE